MEGNPYSEIINVVRGEAKGMQPAAYRIGTVVRESPVAVDVGGALQGAGDLAYLTPAPFVEAQVDETELRYDTQEEAGHAHAGKKERHAHAARVTNGLPVYKTGDKLLLLPIEEEQRYVILGRLVGL